MNHFPLEEHERRRTLIGEAKNKPAPELAENASRYLHGMAVRNVPFVRAVLEEMEAEYAALPAKIQARREQLAEEAYLAGETNEFPPHLASNSDRNKSQ